MGKKDSYGRLLALLFTSCSHVTYALRGEVQKCSHSNIVPHKQTAHKPGRWHIIPPTGWTFEKSQLESRLSFICLCGYALAQGEGQLCAQGHSEKLDQSICIRSKVNVQKLHFCVEGKCSQVRSYTECFSVHVPLWGRAQRARLHQETAECCFF